MTAAEMYAQLAEEVRALSSRLVTADYENAVADAQRETWSLPQTDDFKVLWIKNRSKRHLYSYLRDEAADKVHAKDYKTGDLFKNFSALVDKMDKDFETAQADYPDKFADAYTYELFGTQIDTGFATDALGRDLTYTEDNEVINSPDDET